MIAYDDYRALWSAGQVQFNDLYKFDNDLTPFLPGTSVSSAIGQTVFDMLVTSSNSDRYDMHCPSPYRELLTIWASDRRTTT